MPSHTAGQASSMFGEKARLRRLGGSPLALAVRALCLLDAHHAAGCTVQAALQEVSTAGGEASCHGKGDKRMPRNDAANVARDRALATELTYGALRAERRLGWILSKCVPAPHKLPLPLRRILQAAVYALLFLERVPAHAVLHTAVSLASNLYGARLGGLVNATLRSVQRLGEAPHSRSFYAGKEPVDFFAGAGAGGDRRAEGDEPEGIAEAARFYGLPSTLAVCLAEEAGGVTERVEALFRRSAQRPWHGWRINASSPQSDEVRASALDTPLTDVAPQGDSSDVEGGPVSCRVGEWGVAFAPGRQPDELAGRSLRDWEGKGVISAQAAGSQAVLDELGLRDWIREQRPVWDACAGQGGKGLALREQGGMLALCTDTSRSRLERIAHECRRLGLPCPALALADARFPVIRPGSWSGGIIADVPCSGLGVLARRPDIRRRPFAEMRRLAEVQRDIAAALARCLAVGGELAYMTCTLRREENEEQVEHLLHLPDVRLECCTLWKTPWDHPWLEGMFGARLRRVA